MRNLSNGFFALACIFALGVSINSQALEVGDKAPCVVLQGVESDGEKSLGCIRDASSEEHEYTILDFFSVRCSTCLASLPALSQLSKDIADVATVRQVSVDRDIEAIKQYLIDKKELIAFPVAFDVENSARRAYGVLKTPTLFVIKKIAFGDYDVLYRHTGMLTEEHAQEIKDIVSEE